MKPGPRQIRLIMELRAEGITDPDVLGAIERTPREEFVPEQFRIQAYDNTALPIGQGQTISQPFIVGLMTQALELFSRAKVLEIGTGCGYQGWSCPCQALARSWSPWDWDTGGHM